MPGRILETVAIEAAILRDGEDLLLALAAPEPEAVQVYAADDADGRHPLATLKPGEQVRLTGLGAGRPLLRMVRESGASWLVAERLVPLAGAQNFRDLGGYRTADGRRVAWGKVFRADTLSDLHEEDVAFLSELGVHNVIDLRHDDEVEDAPNALAGRPGFSYLRAPLGNRNVDPKEWRDLFEGGEASFDASFLTRSYIDMLDDCASTFARIFESMAAPETGLPAVFHCTAGKDRTGVTSSLLLLSLGVPEDLVLGDYALTGVYTGNRIRGAERYFRERGIDPEVAAPLMSSHRELMAQALHHLAEEYGSAERYLREHAGLSAATMATLRDQLLTG